MFYFFWAGSISCPVSLNLRPQVEDLERNQSHCVLSEIVQGRRSLVVAST
jgi:hypothetical protein